jgi:hypothetical protein
VGTDFNPASLLTSFFSRRRLRRRDLRRFLGDPGVGKTSTAGAASGRTFFPGNCRSRNFFSTDVSMPSAAVTFFRFRPQNKNTFKDRVQNN